MTVTAESPPDAAALRAGLARFPTGVGALCAVVDGTPVGMATSSFTSVSLLPPLVSVCIARTSTTWPVLRGAAGLGLSVLGAEHAALCRQLSARGVDRFAGVAWQPTPVGGLVLEGAALWLHVRLVDELPAGDHDIALLAVDGLQAFDDVDPLLFHDHQLRALPR